MCFFSLFFFINSKLKVSNYIKFVFSLFFYNVFCVMFPYSKILGVYCFFLKRKKFALLRYHKTFAINNSKFSYKILPLFLLNKENTFLLVFKKLNIFTFFNNFYKKIVRRFMKKCTIVLLLCY